MAYGVANVEFNPRVIPESYIVLREVPTFEFGTQFSNLKAITSVLSPRYPVVRIKNDCVITTGKAPLEAFDRLEVAEYSAKATIDAAALGGMNPINDEQVADLVKAFKLIP
jgi:L-fuculose-phosphate aldolase